MRKPLKTHVIIVGTDLTEKLPKTSLELQREIRLQSALNTTTEGLIGLPREAGIYSTVQEIPC
jgi:hypothetical protein